MRGGRVPLPSDTVCGTGSPEDTSSVRAAEEIPGSAAPPRRRRGASSPCGRPACPSPFGRIGSRFRDRELEFPRTGVSSCAGHRALRIYSGGTCRGGGGSPSEAQGARGADPPPPAVRLEPQDPRLGVVEVVEGHLVRGDGGVPFPRPPVA